jgi:hypothetical protein
MRWHGGDIPVRLDAKEIKNGLLDLIATPSMANTVGAKWILRGALELITQMQGDLRRQGFTEYNDKEESQDQ